MKFEATPAEAERLDMSENPLERAEAAAEASAMRKAAPSPVSKALLDSLGPQNNWGQPVNYDVVPLPAEFDASKPPTDAAPLGFLKSGVPYSPYGNRPTSGKPRIKPAPTLKGRDKHLAGAPGEPATVHRLAPSAQKPPPELANVYASIDADYNRLKEEVEEVRRRHPETKYGVPPHPRAMGSGEIVRADPQVGANTVELLLLSVTGFLSDKIEDKQLRPSPKAIAEASARIAEASKYYGIDSSPKAAATGAAAFALVVVFLPYILYAGGKLIDKITGSGPAKVPA